MKTLDVEHELFMDWVEAQLLIEDTAEFVAHQANCCGGDCAYCQNDRRYEVYQKENNHAYQI